MLLPPTKDNCKAPWAKQVCYSNIQPQLLHLWKDLPVGNSLQLTFDK